MVEQVSLILGEYITVSDGREKLAHGKLWICTFVDTGAAWCSGKKTDDTATACKRPNERRAHNFYLTVIKACETY